jgi:hypothetical protein
MISDETLNFFERKIEMCFNYITDELKLDISGNLIELDKHRSAYPYTPQGNCKLEDLKDETGVSFPKYVDLFVSSDKIPAADFLSDLRINKNRWGSNIELKYYFNNNSSRQEIHNILSVSGLTQHFHVEEYEKCLSREIALNDSIHQAINLDLRLLACVK